MEKLVEARQNTKFILAVLVTMIMLGVGQRTVAQGKPTQPGGSPPPPGDAATAPGPGAAQPTAAATKVDPLVEREIIDAIVAGKDAVAKLDLASAQSYFEQAFAKCDQHGIKGPLLARVYMGLGTLFAGYLQQVPQGIEFMKMALGINPAVAPEPEMLNAQVSSTFKMVRERLGLVGPAKVDQTALGTPGAVDAGGFWVMKHQRVTQAQRMFPLGLYIETNPMVAIRSAQLFFRLPSDRQYQVANMRKNGTMYGMLIECDAIALLDPQTIYYYIEVVGGDGSVIAREGNGSAPIEVKLVPTDQFDGVQPNLPGMEAYAECDPDAAAPCPPWDPHCKDMPCVTNEDCLGRSTCREGYCIEIEGELDDDEETQAVGLVLSVGLGLGFGIATGKEEALNDADPNIDLAPGLSPSWMFTRLMAGYYVLDNLVLGAFVRFQHIFKDGDNNLKGKWAGMMLPDYFGPMWGPTAWFYFWGDGQLWGPGQVTDESGASLSQRPGLRAYARMEYNIWGAMYHDVTLKGPDDQGNDDRVNRQHASGLQGIGLGFGAVYGLGKYVDIGLEIMYDLMMPDVAHNFDAQLQAQVHF